VPIGQPEAAPKKRRIGFMKGMFKTLDDLDTVMAEEIEELFHGNADKFKGR
jgi:hypothetical protein